MIQEKNVRQIYLIGDLHLGIRGNSAKWLEIQEKFLLQTLPQQMLDNGHKRENYIVNLEGDIFHSRTTLDIRIFARTRTIFAKLSSWFRSVYIILGNHDVYYRDDNSMNSVSILGHLYSNVRVFENPETLQINGIHNFLMLPWIESTERITEVVTQHTGKCQYIICHADVQGASLNNFVKLDKGLDPNALRGYKRIFAGHIHIRQEIRKYGASVSYTGTPYPMDRNDIGNQKGFEILSFVEDQLVEKFVPNHVSPKFIRSNLYKLLEMSVAEVRSLVDNSFVDVQVDNRIANFFSVNSFLDLIKDVPYQKIEFTNYNSIAEIDATAISRNATERGIDLSIPNMLQLWLDGKGYDRSMRTKVQTLFDRLHSNVREQSKTE